jgi:hypothetical protein
LYKTLTLMLYNLINHPNLMGARRSCGQLFSNVYCLSSPVFNYFFFV